MIDIFAEEVIKFPVMSGLVIAIFSSKDEFVSTEKLHYIQKSHNIISMWLKSN